LNNHWTAFGSLFFLLHQDRLFWLLNAPVIGRWFRYVLRISGDSSSVGSLKIDRILPNAIFWWQGDKQVAEFRTHAKFSKRLYYAFAPLWWTLHAWDWCVADRWVPELSFGFATLTSYPDADPETNTVDGSVGFYSAAENSWATVRDNAGSGFDDTALSDVAAYIRAYSTTDTWAGMYRGIFLFNTSALTGSAVISAATKSLYGVSKRDDVAWNAALNIYTSAPASNTALEAGDFDSLGTVAQSDTSITHDSWSITGYNDFALNSTGIGNISKTGITKFGSRFATYDVANSAPTWSSLAINRVNCYYADQTGTTNDPKLVVTYTRPESYITITKNWALE